MRGGLAIVRAVIGYLLGVSPSAWRGRLVVGLTVSAVVSLGALGASPAAYAAGGGITGTVTDASTQTPLNKVEVDLYNANYDLIAQACTGVDGTYTFSGVAAGGYEVGFTSIQTICANTSQNYQAQYYGGQSTPEEATTVTVNDGTTTTGINAALAPGAEITGTVTNASDSAPIGGVEVDVYAPGQHGSILAYTCTGSDGTYSIPGLATGQYVVGFSPQAPDCSGSLNYVAQYYNDQATFASATTLSLTAGQTTASINAALQPGATLEGTVTDAQSSAGVGGIEVDLWDSQATNTGFVKLTCTAANGTYSFSGLPTGTYYVGFNPTGYNCTHQPAYVTQFYADEPTQSTATGVTFTTAGQTISDINVALAQAGAISGTVTDAVTSDPIANIGVSVFLNGSFVEEACTGTNGTYTAGGLDAGTTYTVTFRAQSPCGDVAGYVDQTYAGTITVAGLATTTGINAALTPQASTISGTVTDAQTGAGLANIPVFITDDTQQLGGTVCTGANGTYSYTGLPAATYTVFFDPASTYCGAAQPLVPSYYGDDLAGHEAEHLVLNGSDSLTGINGALQAAGEISGAVTDVVTGKPIDGLPVVLLNSVGVTVASACTAADGTYAISNVAPGAYSVSFRGDLSGCGVPNRYASSALQNVQVSAGETTSAVNAQLLSESQGGLSGTVTDSAAGTPLQGVTVTVYGSTGQVVGTLTTNGSGAYQLLGLTPGPYQVGFSDPTAGYATQYSGGATSLSGAKQVTVSGGAVAAGINASLTRASTATSQSTGSTQAEIAPRLSLLSKGTLRVVGGYVKLTLACAGRASCAVRAALTAVTQPKTKARAIGQSHGTVAAGGTAVLRIKLTGTADRLLAAGATLPVSITVTGSASGVSLKLASKLRLAGQKPKP